LAFFRLSEEVASLVSLEGEVWLQNAENSVELWRSVQVGEWISTPLTGEVYAWANASSCASDVSDWWVASHTGHSLLHTSVATAFLMI